MCWDEKNLDNPLDHLGSYEGLVRKTEQTAAPSDLDQPAAKGGFDFQGSVRQPHVRAASDSSMEFSPTQNMSFAFPPLATLTPTNISMSTANLQNKHSSRPQQHPNPQENHGPATNDPTRVNSSASQSPPSLPSSTRKRKASLDEIPQIGSITQISPPSAPGPATSKKRSHNVIEKRYRANLNDKITELRDSVPSLRTAQKEQKSGSGNKDDDKGDEAGGSGNKLNKAAILSKATEYIRHLEVRNTRLDEENIALKNRLRELDKIQQQQSTTSIFSGPGSDSSHSRCKAPSDFATAESSNVQSHTEETAHEESPDPLYPPEGLIKVPDSFKRMRMESEPQPHYADSLIARQQADPDSSSPVRSHGRPAGVANKFMLGTLAGLMIVGGLDGHKKSDSSERGLLSVPFHLLAKTHDLSQRYLYMPWHIRALFQFGMTSVFVFGCAFLVFLYLFYSRPRSPRRPSKERTSQSSPNVASPTEFRQKAWLTSTQTVRVPRHTFFPEWFAVTSRCFEYCLRCLLGWGLYSWLTGISEDDEKGRVKAWDIALDAQLTGGDTEVSKSRLVLTIFASGTLPGSPARCMIKALHCRILLWRVGSPDSLSCEVSNDVARVLARYQWQLAQRMQQNMSESDENSLPGHLAFLLGMESDDVLSDGIIQRASNMIWNRPTQEATDGKDLLDVVVEDTAIRSPLDAVASWWSSNALQGALIHSFESDGSASRCKEFDSRLELALKSAPATSTAYTRATAIKAVFCDDGRVDNINSVLAAFPRSRRRNPNNATVFVDTSLPTSARAEISTGVRCAMIAAILKGQTDNESSPNSTQFTLKDAVDLFNKLPVDPVELTLLGFASQYHLLHIMSMDERLIPGSSLSSSICSSSSGDTPEPVLDSTECEADSLPIPDLSRVASGLIYWVRNAYNPISSGFTTSLVEKVVEGCVEACRNAGVDIDVNAIVHETDQAAEHSEPATNGDENTTEDAAQESNDDESDSNGSRRASVRSADTGYGSMNMDDACGVKTSFDTPETSHNKRCDETAKVRN